MEESRPSKSMSNGQFPLFSGVSAKALALSATFGLMLCSPSPAQNKASDAKQSAKQTASTREATPEDQQWEKDTRRRILQQLGQEHSDENGRIRPDLYAKAVAHVQRMKVAKQIGPEPAVPPDKK
jgi:hypothetical protein